MSVLNELNTHYALDQSAIDFYQKNRYIKLKQVFSKEVLDHYGDSIDRVVDRLNKNTRPMGNRDTYGKAFLQLFLFNIDIIAGFISSESISLPSLKTD